MKKIRIMLAIGSMALLLAACSSNTNEVANHIPKNAVAVVAVNAGKMLAKLEADGMSVEQMLGAMKAVKANEISEVMDKWKQLKDAGIDWEKPFFLAAVTDTAVANDPTGIVMLASIKDVAKLAAAVKQQTGKEAEKRNGLFVTSYQGSTMAWNDEMVVATMGDKANPAAQIFFDLKAKESVTANKHFNEALQKQADVMIYTSGTSLNNPEAAMALAMVPKAKALAEDIETASWINFEDGKAVMQNETYVGEALGKLLDKYAGPQIDASLIERFGGGNLNTVAAFSFKPELVPAIVEELGVAPLANMSLAQENLTVEEIGKVFKGDFAIMVSDFAIPEKEMGKDGSQPKYDEPKANMIMVARIGDRAIFDKLMAKASEKGLVKMEGNKIVVAEPDADMKDIVIGVEGDLLVISNNAATYASYAAGGKNALKEDLKRTITGQSTAIYVDLQSILNKIPEPMVAEDAPAMAMLAEARKVLQTTSLTLSNYKDGKLSGSGELTMTAGKNGLSHIATLVIAAANAAEKQDASKDTAKAQ